ncbi:MAG TPA: RIP metalloprotease RseP [Syntrophales bacterium]|nr:RIP metalloprotease RseP [Syntrophales bacterium]HON24219.1 RIP metalloprotease RseP [Syntrophales bacterium]HOU77108.1 RIP metalloprotease RseP [Syntrophales bacterium]HPC32788.1 RIP metalloprotease RseP [Syntrophales bacterium]HQG33636.1 RIP metalloprotease RseP [Syntrophales bacterium]
MVGVSVVSVIVLLGILIFAHELGHFLMAKYFRVGVQKFSLGFGRKLIGKKIGETEYLLSLIPLGGYVKLLGEGEGEELTPEEEQRSFSRQSVWKRMAIVVAGPVFNFMLAIIIFTGVYMIGVPVLTTTVGNVQEGSAAYVAGMKTGDVVRAIDGEEITRWDKMAVKITQSGGKQMNFSVMRRGSPLELTIVPRETKGKNIFGEETTSFKIGVSPAGVTEIERLNPAAALWTSLKQTWFITKLTVLSIVKILEGVISPRTLGGPILIAQMAGAQVKEGIIPFILFMALLSINLGVLNLLPIPVLDGGHLLFYLVEAVRGKAVSMKTRERAQQIGFVVLVMLMIFVVMMDIDRLDIKIINDFTKIFTKEP